MNDGRTYERRQFGWVTIVATAVVLVVLVAFGASGAAPVAGPLAIAFPLVLAVGAVFSSMTVRVGDGRVQWWFGPIRALGRSVALEDVVRVEPIRTTIAEGWGIHLTWHGWLWNVSGFNAVQLTLRSGTRYAVGTPEPAQLVAAIERAEPKQEQRPSAFAERAPGG